MPFAVRRSLVVAFFALLARSAGAAAQSTSSVNSVPLAVPTLSHPVQVDGRLTEESWASALVVDLPFETSPAVNGPAPIETRCRLAKSDDRLYLGCVGHDPNPGGIRAQYVDRDAALAHDRITVILDPFDDGQRAFVFSVSAVGVQSDGIFEQTQSEPDYSWNTIWESAGRITDTGFEIELAIPFGSLRFPVRDGTSGTWQLAIERSWPRSQTITTRSSRYDPNDPCRLCYMRPVAADIRARGHAPLLAIPSVTAGRTDRRVDGGTSLQPGRVDLDAGIDLRWSLTSQAGVSATLNPDFSQIEADVLQAEANTRFALFVPERRPFFLEGAEYFRSMLPVVFTRSIRDPIAGAKLAGRAGAWSGGALLAHDRSTELLIPGSFGSTSASVAGGSQAWAGRLSRTLRPNVVVGGMMTTRTGRAYHNTVAGVDLFLRPLRALEVTAQILGSSTGYPASVAAAHGQDSSPLADHAISADGRLSTRNWTVHTRVESIGPQFRADLGFVPQVDVRRFDRSVTRRFWGDDVRWLTRFDVSIGQWSNTTLDGDLKERGTWGQVTYHGPAQFRLSTNPFWMRERFAGVDYPRSGVNVQASIAPGPDLTIALHGRRAGAVDYANRRSARQWRLGADAEFRIGRRVSVDASASRQVFRHQGLLVAREDLARVRPNIGFSPRVFLSWVVQLRSTTRDPAAHLTDVPARQLIMQSQAVFTYRLDGQTALFLGYADLRADETRQAGPIALQPESLAWFFKMSYAWRR